MSTIYILLGTTVGIATLIAVTTDALLFSGLLIAACVLVGIGLYLLETETL